MEDTDIQDIFDTAVKQNDKHQDYAFNGETINGHNFLGICDGHGHGNVIDCIREIDMKDVISTTNNPIDTIKNIISSVPNTGGDGSTVTIVHITDDNIRCSWIGDSSCRIYKNGVEVWRTTDHNCENQNELSRLKEIKCPIERAWDLNVLNDDKMTMKAASYFHVGSYEKYNATYPDKTNMTRCLGHDDKICQDAEIHSINFKITEETSLWKVVVGSDGFWDMTYKNDDKFISSPYTNSTSLLTLANLRWNQPWNYECPITKNITKNKKIPNIDDIAVAIFQKQM